MHECEKRKLGRTADFMPDNEIDRVVSIQY